MAESMAYTCDECGRAKGPSNHWYRAYWVPGVAGPQFVCYTWATIPKAEGSRQLHLCGMDCLVRCMTKAMREE